MAAILGQIWQHINSGGKTAKAKKRQQEDQYSSESERDEHTAKRRRSAHENEDSLSVTASDNEVRQLLNDSDMIRRNNKTKALIYPTTNCFKNWNNSSVKTKV
ncbi:Hypothetical predicted protein [Paramuricea clavata]|uniref:Uncharacterized protein n=1 Tax=Paramuricea clavata TaxID=317549 RepID=A0A6S7HUL5_PARCT|nr:Hypothetical predicted protein [Paramuricea clavata]